MTNDVTPDLERLHLPAGGFTFDALATGPADGELVLFLHGFPEFATCWRHQLRAVGAAGYRAVAFDQRGYSPGARPEGKERYTLDSIGTDALDVATALGHPSFHLVGHDWGGAIAWHLGTVAAERLRTLAVLSTTHPNTFRLESQLPRFEYMKLLRMEGKAEEVLLRDGAASLAAVYEGRVPEDLVADNIRRLSEPGALTAALNWYRAPTGSWPGALVTAPTLFVWSDQDMAFGPEAAEATEQWVAAPYEFVPLRGRSHWLPEEAPEETTAALLKHLTDDRGFGS